MPILYVFRGPPATGKSTMRAQMLADNPTIRYVNKDELRELRPDATEREIRQHQMDEMAIFASEGRDIIIDNTNLNPRTVDSYRAWAQTNGYTLDVQTFGREVSCDEAVMRDRMRGAQGGRYVGSSVIWQMYVDAGFVPIPAPEDRTLAVMFDIDGTLANIEHRRHFVQESPKNWRAFNAAMHLDTVNVPVRMAYQAHNRSYTTILMSGRGSERRAVTETWLERNAIADYALLLMRPFNDRRADHIVKHELYMQYVEPWYDVRIVYDDRTSVVNLWRSLGLACFQVAPGDF